MDRDSALLEEAYLNIVETYYGYASSEYDREDPFETKTFDLSFFIAPTKILNKTYITHFYCNDAEISGNPEEDVKSRLNYSYENESFLIWDVEKTPEIIKFYEKQDSQEFVDYLTDEIIDEAIINFPSKNPDFLKKYRYHPLYGKIIRKVYDMADDYLWEKWKMEF
jgi:hypothetical protein